MITRIESNIFTNINMEKYNIYIFSGNTSYLITFLDDFNSNNNISVFNSSPHIFKICIKSIFDYTLLFKLYDFKLEYETLYRNLNNTNQNYKLEYDDVNEGDDKRFLDFNLQYYASDILIFNYSEKTYSNYLDFENDYDEVFEMIDELKTSGLSVLELISEIIYESFEYNLTFITDINSFVGNNNTNIIHYCDEVSDYKELMTAEPMILNLFKLSIYTLKCLTDSGVLIINDPNSEFFTSRDLVKYIEYFDDSSSIAKLIFINEESSYDNLKLSEEQFINIKMK